MLKTGQRIAGVIAIGISTVLIVSACTPSGSSSSSSSSTKTLVVDNSFDLKTSDPARAFEFTGSIVDRVLYDTALTFNGSDVTKPVSSITSYKENADNTVLTLTMNGKHTFSDGTPVTADDVVWSLKRVQAIAGNPSFLLQGVAVAKTSANTITLTSTTPNPALPFILPNPSLGILNSKLLEKHGGTDTKADQAEAYLNSTSAGSGPYILKSYSVTTKVVFALNPHYTGPAPAFGNVVLENVAAPTQKINVQAGQSQVALDLNADQVAGIGGNTTTIKGTSPDVIYSWFNQNATVGAGVTNNQDFLKAVRQGIDYAKIESLTGAGSTQPGGLIPSQFLGALKSDPSNKYDLNAAKAALAASGYHGQSMSFAYPNDFNIAGLQFQTLAEAIQSQLKAVGINMTLFPMPISTFLDAYRAAKLQAGIVYWGPDFPDPSDYLVFNPGQDLGLRAGWVAGADPTVTAAANAASAAVGPTDRATAYQSWQTAANASGPFLPIVQPGQYVVTAKSITHLELNPVWTVDLAEIK
ncbi:MAG TPA: ABC transporter substrate-binding protein [Microbacteriaceae bacterium]